MASYKDDMALVACLRQRMEELHIDGPTQLASALDIGQPMATKYLNGSSVPPDGRAEQLAEFLDTSVDHVLRLLWRARRDLEALRRGDETIVRLGGSGPRRLTELSADEVQRLRTELEALGE